MAENFTVDPPPPPPEGKVEDLRRFVLRYHVPILAVLVATCVGLFIYLLLFSSNVKRVVLHDTDFYCSQQTATKRFSFDKVETCDQYTRKVAPARWSK